MASALRRVLAATAMTVAATVGIAACSTDTTGHAGPASPASSSNSAILPTPPGVQPDSIEDVNSTKDMTGVVTTYSDADSPKNPYYSLIPYICPFLPDSITRGKLGMTDIINGFGGQHSLLNLCNMNGDTGEGGATLAISVAFQATSFADESAKSTHINIATNVPVWRNISGLVFKNAGDDNDRFDGTPRRRKCNLVWGTFYGTVLVSVFAQFGYKIDPCKKVVEVSKLVAPYLPSKPIQMRPEKD